MVNLTAKKIYCPKCKVLRRVKSQKTGEKNQFTCTKCDSLIWLKEGLAWKYKRGE